MLTTPGPTQRKKARNPLRGVVCLLTTGVLISVRHEPLKEQAEQITQGLRGHYAYYGIAGNVGSLLRVYRNVERYWRKMLGSRSQKGSLRWDVFSKMKRTYPLQRPKLYLPYRRLKQYAVLRSIF
jgi:RNA-directed DNA polymerase